MRGSLGTQYSVQLIEYSNDWLIYENELLLLLFTTKPVCVCVCALIGSIYRPHTLSSNSVRIR